MVIFSTVPSANYDADATSSKLTKTIICRADPRLNDDTANYCVDLHGSKKLKEGSTDHSVNPGSSSNLNDSSANVDPRLVDSSKLEDGIEDSRKLEDSSRLDQEDRPEDAQRLEDSSRQDGPDGSDEYEEDDEDESGNFHLIVNEDGLFEGEVGGKFVRETKEGDFQECSDDGEVHVNDEENCTSAGQKNNQKGKLVVQEVDGGELEETHAEVDSNASAGKDNSCAGETSDTVGQQSNIAGQDSNQRSEKEGKQQEGDKESQNARKEAGQNSGQCTGQNSGKTAGQKDQIADQKDQHKNAGQEAVAGHVQEAEQNRAQCAGEKAQNSKQREDQKAGQEAGQKAQQKRGSIEGKDPDCAEQSTDTQSSSANECDKEWEKGFKPLKLPKQLVIKPLPKRMATSVNTSNKERVPQETRDSYGPNDHPLSRRRYFVYTDDRMREGSSYNLSNDDIIPNPNRKVADVNVDEVLQEAREVLEDAERELIDNKVSKLFGLASY